MPAPKNNLSEKKSQMSLLPMDILKKYVVPAYEEGVIKYKRESWREGFKTSTMINAALRHIEAFYWGREDIDPDSVNGKHHLGGAIFSLLSILHSTSTHPNLDDRHLTLVAPKEVLKRKTLSVSELSGIIGSRI